MKSREVFTSLSQAFAVPPCVIRYGVYHKRLVLIRGVYFAARKRLLGFVMFRLFCSRF